MAEEKLWRDFPTKDEADLTGDEELLVGEDDGSDGSVGKSLKISELDKRYVKEGTTEAGGLDEEQVDARVRAGVKDYAETDSTDKIPFDDLDSSQDSGLQGYVTAQVVNQTRKAALINREINADERALFRAHIGAEASGVDDYVETDLGDLNWNQHLSNALVDTTLDIPPGAHTLLVRAENDQHYVGFDIATLLALPNVNTPGTQGNNTNSLMGRSCIPHSPGDCTDFRVAHNGNSIWFASSDIGQGTADFRYRSARPVPKTELPSDTVYSDNVRLLPAPGGAGNAGQVAQVNTQGTGYVLAALTTGGGLTESAARDLIATWARASGASGTIPDSVLPSSATLLPVPQSADAGHIVKVNPAGTAFFLAVDEAGEDGDEGPPGQSPVIAVVEDGERRVLQIVDWYPLTGARDQVVSNNGGRTTLPTDSGFTSWVDAAPEITASTGADGLLNVTFESTAEFRRSTALDGQVALTVQAQVVITSTAGISRTVSLTPVAETGTYPSRIPAYTFDLSFTGTNIPIASGEKMKVQIRADRAGQTGRDVMDVRLLGSDADPTTVEWRVPGAPRVFDYIAESGATETIGDATDIRGAKGDAGTDANVATAVFKFARIGQTLSSADQDRARGRIDAAKEGDAPFVDESIGSFNWNTGARTTIGEDTGLQLPADAEYLLVRTSAQATQYVRIDADTLRGLARYAGGNTVMQDGVNALRRVDPGSLDGEDDDTTFFIAIGTNGNLFGYGDQAASSGTFVFHARKPYVASEALEGNTDRWPKDKLPTDTVYDGDDALLPDVTTANAGQVLKVNASGDWATGTDDTGSGGGGRTQVDRGVSLSTATTVTSSTTDYSDWEDLASITIGSTETGKLLLIADARGVTDSATAGADRVSAQMRVVRTRASVDTALAVVRTEYIRNNGQGGANFNASTQIGSMQRTYRIDALQGDVYKIQVQYISQTAARTVTHAADDTNAIAIWRG